MTRLPPFYLGQSLVLIGRPEEAAAAYERALQRKPRRNDLLDIFQALGRVYQRGQKLDQALAVWGRLEQLFPGDQQVQEQAASALAEEGQAEPALERYERLARSVRDPFRQAQLAMTAADLKVRLGRTEPALHDFESLLDKLRPDSWLYREVRRKIEDVFLRNDDQAGLAGVLRALGREEPRGRRGPGPPGPEPRDPGPDRRRPRLVREGRQAGPVAPRPAPRPDRSARPGPEVRRGRRAVRGPRPGRAQQPRHPARLGRPGPARHLEARGRPQGGRRRGLAQADGGPAQGPGHHRSGRRPLPPGRDGRRRPGALSTGHRAGTGQRPVSRIPRRVPPRAEAPRRGPGRVGQDRRGVQPRRQEPGAAGGGPLRLRLHQAGDPAHDPGGRAGPRRLRPRHEARRAAPSGRTVRRGPGPARRGGEAGGARRGEGRGARGPDQERPGGRPAHRAGRGPAQGAGGRGREGARRVLVAAGPLPRGRRQAPRGRPRRRPGDRGRPPIGAGLGPRGAGSASRRATWATPPRPTAAWPRSTAATGPST